MKKRDFIIITIMGSILIMGILAGIAMCGKPDQLTIQAQAMTEGEQNRTIDLIREDEQIMQQLYKQINFVPDQVYAKFWFQHNGKFYVWYSIPGIE